TSGSHVGRDFFVVRGSSGSPAASMLDLALSISVNTDLDNVRNVAAAQDPGVSGDGRVAEQLFLLQTATNTPLMQVNKNYIPGPPTVGTPAIPVTDSTSGSPVAVSMNINAFNNQRVTEFSLTLQKATTMNGQHENLLTALVQDRESVAGVSLDEEAANLIKYQQAYNASIRMMTAVDEMLDRVINNMGTVGR
ncbi:MAG: hypothetical protein LWX83_02330, partial [Anaerolineae bacterium]|nr:hypothetical protein [Anaerolineae bacterium]